MHSIHSALQCVAQETAAFKHASGTSRNAGISSTSRHRLSNTEVVRFSKSGRELEGELITPRESENHRRKTLDDGGVAQ